MKIGDLGRRQRGIEQRRLGDIGVEIIGREMANRERTVIDQRGTRRKRHVRRRVVDAVDRIGDDLLARPRIDRDRDDQNVIAAGDELRRGESLARRRRARSRDDRDIAARIVVEPDDLVAVVAARRAVGEQQTRIEAFEPHDEGIGALVGHAGKQAGRRPVEMVRRCARNPQRIEAVLMRRRNGDRPRA